MRRIPLALTLATLLAGCGAHRATRVTVRPDEAVAGRAGEAGAGRLPDSALPYLGLSCHRPGSRHIPNSIACDQVGIGVTFAAPARRVTVEVAGATVSLTPPKPPSDIWLGYLDHAGLRHGPLDVHAAPGATKWFGTPEVAPWVTVSVYLPDGTVLSRTARGFLHPGFG
jgi:hypothetical protein